MKESLFLLAIALLFLSCESRFRQNSPQTELRDIKREPVPKFDGQKSFRYLTAQTDFGPRVPGSEGHARCLQFLQSELRRFADTVVLQEFSHSSERAGLVKLTNVMGRFNLKSDTRILLTAHWDTRPWADSDSDPKNRTKPILGANDGASGVAVLLEVGRVLKDNPPNIGVDIVLFDGEDLGTQGDLDTWCAGSKFFAKHLPEGFLPRFGLNLDMVGDRNLLISREQKSERFAPDVMNLVFSAAREAAVGQFIDSPGDDVYDDHVPLNEAGIRTINLIDFSYPDDTINYWHTTEDTPDKCSGESLEAVGTVLLHLIYSKSANF